MTTPGTLAVLNTGAGDITVAFNTADAEESARAIDMLLDMKARGYAIMVRLADGTYTRAVDIDANTGHYVVLAPSNASPVESSPEAEATPTTKRRGRPRRERVPIDSASAVGVARSAGGCDRVHLQRLADARCRA
jgi:hypothetical protein